MNHELIQIAYFALSGMLFATGGTGDWAFASKSWRRIGIPLASCAYLFRVSYINNHSLDGGIVIFSCVVLGGVLTLGYGESKPWWYKCLVGVSYTVPSMFFGISPWIIVLPVAFLGLFWASNHEKLAKYVPWKCWEFLMGVLIAFTFVAVVG